MKHPTRARPTWLAATALAVTTLASGCALTSKSDSVTFRYFSPSTEHVTLTGEARPQGATGSLRLGRINAASYLKERIAFRDSPYELGYYDGLRWTEKPEAFLRRALRTSFFEEHHVRQAVSGFAPTLDVDLNAFEEMKSPRHAARVSLTWTLRDDQNVLMQESFTVDHEIPGSKDAEADPAAFTAALSKALDESVTRLVGKVLQAVGGK